MSEPSRSPRSENAVKAPLSPADFLAELRRRGIGIVAEGDALRVRWTPEGRKPRIEAYLRRNKPALLALLREMEPEMAPAPPEADPLDDSLAGDPEAGRADLHLVEALVAQAHAGALPRGPVTFGPDRTVADPNAAALDLWERMLGAKAAGRIADAQSLAGDLLTLADWWEYPGLADTSDLADPFVDDPGRASLGAAEWRGPEQAHESEALHAAA